MSTEKQESPKNTSNSPNTKKDDAPLQGDSAELKKKLIEFLKMLQSTNTGHSKIDNFKVDTLDVNTFVKLYEKDAKKIIGHIDKLTKIDKEFSETVKEINDPKYTGTENEEIKKIIVEMNQELYAMQLYNFLFDLNKCQPVTETKTQENQIQYSKIWKILLNKLKKINELSDKNMDSIMKKCPTK